MHPLHSLLCLAALPVVIGAAISEDCTTPSSTSTSSIETCTTSTSSSTKAVTVTVTVTASPRCSTTTPPTSTRSPTSTTSTSSSTSTTTILPTGPLPTPTQCGNQGLQFAIYQNPFNTPNTDSSYSQYKPEAIKTVTPEYQGVTFSLGGFDYRGSDNATIYGQYTRNITYFVINHQGYIYAPTTGSYTFTLNPNVDDILNLWTGTLAESGWTRANSQIDGVFTGTGGTYVAQLTKGTYTPIRLIFGQAGGAAIFSMQVTAPDGTVFLGPDTGASGYLVQYSCDGILAPRFEPFGMET